MHNRNAVKIYIRRVAKTACKVPLGIETFGRANSPDILAPAISPTKVINSHIFQKKINMQITQTGHSAENNRKHKCEVCCTASRIVDSIVGEKIFDKS